MQLFWEANAASSSLAECTVDKASEGSKMQQALVLILPLAGSVTGQPISSHSPQTSPSTEMRGQTGCAKSLPKQ